MVTACWMSPCASMPRGGAGRLDAESETLIPTIGGGFDGPVAMRESGQGYWMQDDIAGTLRAEGEDRPSRPSHVIGTPVAFHPTQDPISGTDVCHAIGTGSGRGCATAAVAWGISNQPTPKFAQEVCPSLDAKTTGGGRMEAVAFDTYNQDLNPHVTHSLRDGNSEGTPALLQAMQVRRLTPTECERLQGFPDGYTNIPWRGKPESPDGPRYKALGNSWAVPVVRWIGRRINRFLEATP